MSFRISTLAIVSPWLAAAALGACSPSHIQVNRTALVPPPQPILFSASPDTRFEFIANGASTLGEPSLNDESAGLQAARGVMGGSIEILTRYVTIRHHCLVAGDNGSTKLSPHQPEIEHDSATGCGPVFTVRTGDQEGQVNWHFGLGATLWSIPVVEYERWDNDSYTATGIEAFDDSIVQWAFAVGPTYHRDRLSLRGGVTATSQFYVPRVSNYYGYYEADGGEVSRRFAMVASAGVGYDLAKNIRVGLDLASELMGDPVRWAPQVAVHLAVGLGERHPPKPTPPTPPTPPMPPSWGPPGATPPSN